MVFILLVVFVGCFCWLVIPLGLVRSGCASKTLLDSFGCKKNRERAGEI